MADRIPMTSVQRIQDARGRWLLIQRAPDRVQLLLWVEPTPKGLIRSASTVDDIILHDLLYQNPRNYGNIVYVGPGRIFTINNIKECTEPAPGVDPTALHTRPDAA